MSAATLETLRRHCPINLVLSWMRGEDEIGISKGCVSTGEGDNRGYYYLRHRIKKEGPQCWSILVGPRGATVNTKTMDEAKAWLREYCEIS